MKIISTYVTTQYVSTRKGATGEVISHPNSMAEIYAPALKPDDWYLIKTIGVREDGSEVQLSRVVVKR